MGDDAGRPGAWFRTIKLWNPDKLDERHYVGKRLFPRTIGELKTTQKKIHVRCYQCHIEYSIKPFWIDKECDGVCIEEYSKLDRCLGCGRDRVYWHY